VNFVELRTRYINATGAGPCSANIAALRVKGSAATAWTNSKSRELIVMPECEFCGEQASRIYTCKQCGTFFCVECGSPSEKLCIVCLAEEEGEDWEDEEDSEEESEDDGYSS